MKTRSQPSFLRLFAGGFVAGAIAMVSIHGVQPDDLAMIPPAQAQTTAVR